MRVKTQSPRDHPSFANATVMSKHTAQAALSLTINDMQTMIHQALSIGNTTTLSSSDTSILSDKSLDRWFFDFGVSNHMTFNFNLFQHVSSLHSPPHIQTANRSFIIASHNGTIHSHNLTLSDVLLTPQLSMNLISIGQLCEK